MFHTRCFHHLVADLERPLRVDPQTSGQPGQVTLIAPALIATSWSAKRWIGARNNIGGL